jgi:hydrogenase nickel incorporation protein HypA/HybF
VHELSIAESIVAVAERHAAGRPVVKVELLVGHLRQVVPSALEFAFQLVSQGTVLDGAELAIEDVPARGLCRACRTETTMSGFPFACSACGGLDLEVLAGEELLVDSLELEEMDEAFATTGGGSDGHG